jgi:1-aminocyclopropane-1-carboxylate deaminase/D-cysteine desulfhydrase-like pyridoxal-dependent ACC family enzyme
MVRRREFTESRCVLFLHTGGTPALFADLGTTRA